MRPRLQILRQTRVPALAALLLACAALLQGCDSTTAQEHLQNARTLLDQGERAAGIIELRNALQKQPDLAPARALLGAAYERQGDWRAAQREYRRAVDAGLDDAMVRAGLLRSQLRNGQVEAVLSALRGRDDLDPAMTLILADAELTGGHVDEAAVLYGQLPSSAGSELGLGRIAAGRGLLEPAAGHFARAVELDPGDGDAWLGKGEFELANRRFESASAAFEQALRRPATRLPAHLGLARSRLAEDDLDGAAEHAGWLVKTVPGLPAGHYLAALVAFRRDDPEAARGALDKVLERQPEHPGALYLMAAVDVRSGHSGQAEKRLRKLLEGAGDSLDARLLLAALYVQRNDDPAAVDVLQPLVDGAEEPRALAMYGAAQMRLGNVGEATRALEQAVDLAPDMAALRYQLAVGLASGGDTAGAEVELRVASVLDGSQPDSDYLLALVRLRRDDADGALAAARSLLSKAPDSPVGHNLLGSVQQAMGHAEQARAAYQAALARDPDFLPARENLARLDGRPLEDVYREVLAAQPGNAAALLALADLAVARGDGAAATELLERAVAAEPDSAPAKLALARRLLAEDRPGDAREVCRAALAQAPGQVDLMLLDAQIAIADGRPEDARRRVGRLQRLLDRSALRPELRLAVADLQARLGMLGPARGNLEQVATGGGTARIPALRALVRLDLRDRSFRSAHARLDTLTALGDGGAGLALLRADVQTASGELTQARRAYRDLADAGNRLALVRLAELDLRQGGEPPLALLSGWVETHPEDSVMRRLLADTLLASDRQAALGHYQRLLPTEDPVVLNNLAWLYQQRGDPQAEAMARRALAAAPGNPSVLDTLGWILVGQGRSEEAIAALRDSLRTAPGNPSVLYHLGEALRRSGDVQGAQAALQRALRSADFPEREAADTALTELVGS